MFYKGGYWLCIYTNYSINECQLLHIYIKIRWINIFSCAELNNFDCSIYITKFIYYRSASGYKYQTLYPINYFIVYTFINLISRQCVSCRDTKTREDGPLVNAEWWYYHLIKTLLQFRSTYYISSVAFFPIYYIQSFCIKPYTQL